MTDYERSVIQDTIGLFYEHALVERTPKLDDWLEQVLLYAIKRVEGDMY